MGFRVQAIESLGFDTSEFRDGLRFAMDECKHDAKALGRV